MRGRHWTLTRQRLQHSGVIRKLCTTKQLSYQRYNTTSLSAQLTTSQLLLMCNRSATLLLIRLDLGLEIPSLVRLPDLRLPTLSNHNPRTIRKQIVHLLERSLRRLRKQQPEEHRVREVADDEQVVEPVPDILHRDRRDLADHGVEGEAHHGRERDALGAGARVEDFGWDDP